MKLVYFISGHEKYSQEMFDYFYKPLIDDAISRDCNFVVGDADGVSTMAQKYLASKLPKEDHNRVKIFFKGDVPNQFISPSFTAIGNFKCNEEANAAMTICSNYDIVCLSEGHSFTNAGKNIIRRFTPLFNFKKYLKTGNVKFWKMIYNDIQDNNKQ